MQACENAAGKGLLGRAVEEGKVNTHLTAVNTKKNGRKADVSYAVPLAASLERLAFFECITRHFTNRTPIRSCLRFLQDSVFGN